MYKIKFLIVILVMSSVNTAMADLPGLGTEADPWRIESRTDFNEFAADPNYWEDYTRLETDVNLAGNTYSNALIAPDVNNLNFYFDGEPFTGVFDGNGHKIICVTIDDGGAGHGYLGLFGRIEDDGEVKNLGVESISVSGGHEVGGLAGCTGNHYTGACGNVSNCWVIGDVNGFWGVGGLIGDNDNGSVSNSYFNGTVTGNDSVGGLIGDHHGVVSNCYSVAEVIGANMVGGLVGYNSYDGSNVSNCYSAGSVTGNGYAVGGLVGRNDYSVVESFSTSDVNGSNQCVGGFVGSNNSGSISNCFSTGNVNGSDWYVGGLVGLNSGSVTTCYSISDVNGYEGVGGLVGRNVDLVSGCLWDTETQNHGVTQSIAYNSGTVINTYGKSTEQMKQSPTFLIIGWDFVGESDNGTEDTWTIHETVDYPKLVWKLVNFIDWYHVDLIDYAFFANHWNNTNCGAMNDCNGTDLDFSGTVDIVDLGIFCNHWLE